MLIGVRASRREDSLLSLEVKWRKQGVFHFKRQAQSRRQNIVEEKHFVSATPSDDENNEKYSHFRSDIKPGSSSVLLSDPSEFLCLDFTVDLDAASDRNGR